jgi:hypothetical protein
VAVLNAFFRLTVFLLLASAASGCGPVWYEAEIISAGSIVAEAEHADATEHSPYEYWAAREYLDKAREEAGGGSYEDAIHYAQEAHRYAVDARDQSRARMRDDLASGRHDLARPSSAHPSSGDHD